MRRLVPSPALAIAIVALFVALGGTGYAATKLAANSVGTKQIKKNAVTGSKVKKGSLTGSDINLAKLGTVPNAKAAETAGSAGTANSAKTADTATNATNAQNAGNASNLGGKPASFYGPATLPSGETQTGPYAATGVPPFASTTVTYPIPLAAALGGGNVVYLKQGSAPTANCPGKGKAAPGFLCVYETSGFNVAPNNGHAINTGAGAGGSEVGGFMLFFDITAGSGYSYGSWAVTAP
jgi:hypothetical protein